MSASVGVDIDCAILVSREGYTPVGPAIQFVNQADALQAFAAESEAQVLAVGRPSKSVQHM